MDSCGSSDGAKLFSKFREKPESCSIQEMISILKSSCRPLDFETVERMLMSQKRNLKLDKEASEDRMKEAIKREVELEAELNAYRIRCAELENTSRNDVQVKRALSIELETVKKELLFLEDKLGGLEFEKYQIEDELKKSKSLCENLKEHHIRLQENYTVVCEREKRAQGRISTLSEELKKIGDETREKFVQLKVENRDLLCGKKRAEDEIEMWKKKFGGVGSNVNMLAEDSLVLTNYDPRSIRNLEAEYRGSLVTISHKDDKEKKEASFASNIQEEATGLGDGACYKRLNCDVGTNRQVNVGSSCRSLSGERINVKVTGPLRSCTPPEFLINVREEKVKLQDGTPVRRHLESEQGTTNNRKVGSKPGIGRSIDAIEIDAVNEIGEMNIVVGTGKPIDVVEIDSDNETSEMNTALVAASNFRGKGKTLVSVDNSFNGVLKDKKGMAPENYLNRINSSQKGEAHGSISKESHKFSSASKRKRDSNIT